MTFRDETYGNHLRKGIESNQAGEAISKPSAREKDKPIPTDSSKKVLKT